jgi:hypothetical protein
MKRFESGSNFSHKTEMYTTEIKASCKVRENLNLMPTLESDDGKVGAGEVGKDLSGSFAE